MSPYAFAVTWAVQATLLGLVALVLPRLFRVRQPSLLESWWGVGALGVVLLPVLPVLLPSRGGQGAPPALVSFVESTTVAFSTVADAPSLLSPLAWLAVVWVFGVVVRLAWLVAGQGRLARLAASGQVVDDDPALIRARALADRHPSPLPLRDPVPVIATEATGPCAFGWRRVQVLVPRELAHLPEEQRVSVYLHELLHAVRFDVPRSYVDEAWRLAWWWQPAVWWMLARLRLVRELHVDRAVVASTGARRAYVEALLWCGARRQPLGLSSQVGGGRHALVRRVALLCEEVEVTRLRRWSTALALCLVFATVSSVVAMHSPLRAAQSGGQFSSSATEPGPLERVAVRPTLDAPAPRRVVAVDPVWADTGVGYRFRAHIVIDAAGRVAEARLVGMSAIELAPDGPVPEVSAAREAAIAALRQWQFESPVQSPMLLVTDIAVGKGAVGAESYTRSSWANGTQASSARPPLRVGGAIAPPRKVFDVAPVYPQVAMDAKVQGVVIIECTIDTEGTVGDARVLRSVPLLDEAAVDAVQQWRYTPTLVNGEAVPVIVTVTVNFTLR